MNVQLTGKHMSEIRFTQELLCFVRNRFLPFCNFAQRWGGKKEFFLMQPKLEEYGHSRWNLATKSCLQSLKFTTLARFNASEGFKPSKCFLTTWSHIHHAGLAPSQPGPVVYSRLPVAVEPSVCQVHAVKAWDRGNMVISLFFTTITECFFVLVHRSAYCKDRSIT